MSNKIILILLTGILSFSLAAQNSRYNRRNRSGSRNPSIQQRKTENPRPDTAAAASRQTNPAQSGTPAAGPTGKFDPRKPALTMEMVKKVLEENIRKKVLERKIPVELNKCTAEQFFSMADCSAMLDEYQRLIQNFELTEVTRIRLEWYQRYAAELEKFTPIAKEMYFSMRKLSEPRFAAAVHAFQKQQEACLKFLKERPPRIHSDQYNALQKKNTRLRQQNYLRRQQEKRQADLKRRQEALKPKNEKSQ